MAMMATNQGVDVERNISAALYGMHDDAIKLEYLPRYWPYLKATGHRWIPLKSSSNSEH